MTSPTYRESKTWPTILAVVHHSREPRTIYFTLKTRTVLDVIFYQNHSSPLQAGLTPLQGDFEVFITRRNVVSSSLTALSALEGSDLQNVSFDARQSNCLLVHNLFEFDLVLSELLRPALNQPLFCRILLCSLTKFHHSVPRKLLSRSEGSSRASAPLLLCPLTPGRPADLHLTCPAPP